MNVYIYISLGHLQYQARRSLFDMNRSMLFGKKTTKPVDSARNAGRFPRPSLGFVPPTCQNRACRFLHNFGI